MSPLRYIDADEVRKKLDMPAAIKAMSAAFKDLSSGRALVPDRLPFHTGEDSEYLFMPAYFPAGGITTIKSVSINAENPKKGLPFIHAVILAFDQETGRPLATVDGSEVTAIRTAAASGLATDLFANPDSRVGAIFGTGVQARTHIEAITAVRDINKIYVFGRNLEKSRDFCDSVSISGSLELVPTDNFEDLGKVDILCTTTTSNEPVFDPQYVKPGTHMNAVGVFKPDCREIPEEMVISADVYIDQLQGAMAEAGDLLIPLSKGKITKEHFSKEIGQVLNGDLEYQWSPDRITLFKSVGNAIQDAAAVKVLLDKE